MNSGQNTYMDYSQSENLMPQEEILETTRDMQQIIIGIPKEISYQEKRIALVPDAAGLLIANGHQVIMERGAGENAHFNNKEYSEKGVQIVESVEQVFQSDIILKIAPPVESEIQLMKEKQTLLSALHITNRNRDFFKKLSYKKITAIAYEYIQDKTRSYPLIRSISEIVGKASVLIASQYLGSKEYGRGEMLGGFPGICPTEVVILGAGTVGENAARAAIGMGAQLKIFDHSTSRLRRLSEKLNTQVFTSTIQPRILAKAVSAADVIIGAIHSTKGRSPCVVSKDMIMNMKQGSVIIDVSIDQGGCFETSRLTSHDDPVFKEYGITHYCVPNISSSVPNTASYALSNFLTPVILRTGETGGMENLLRMDYGLSKGVYLYNGIITNTYLSETFNLPFQDLDLILAAFRG